MKRMKHGVVTSLIILLFSVFFCSSYDVRGEELKPSETLSDALVKIYATRSSPEFYRPWRKYYLQSGVGSGCIIAGNRILTNAHVISNQTFVEVQRNGQDQRIPASVLYVSHEADLALLTVEDEKFFTGVTPLTFGSLPKAQDEVMVYGFPKGGNTLSITKGIVSRIEYDEYAHSSLYFLTVQVDAAINPGNSGGPVIKENTIVGVVMQNNPTLENAGYMVPIPLVTHFLEDIEDGRNDGFPSLGLVVQILDKPDLKRKLQLDESQGGLLVNYVLPDSPGDGILNEQDVILKIDDQKIFNDGTIEFRQKERMRFKYLVDTHQIGDSIKLEIFRDDQVFETSLKLTKPYNDLTLVPLQTYDQLPRYLIFGGIVFSPLTKNLILEWGSDYRSDAPDSYLVEFSNYRTSERHEVVVAIQVLPAQINRGYHSLNNWIVHDVNGKTFKNFDEFCQLVMNSESEYVTFKDKWSFQVVIDRKKARESHAQILQTYDIQAGTSPDLKFINP